MKKNILVILVFIGLLNQSLKAQDTLSLGYGNILINTDDCVLVKDDLASKNVICSPYCTKKDCKQNAKADNPISNLDTLHLAESVKRVKDNDPSLFERLKSLFEADTRPDYLISRDLINNYEYSEKKFFFPAIFVLFSVFFLSSLFLGIMVLIINKNDARVIIQFFGLKNKTDFLKTMLLISLASLLPLSFVLSSI